MKEWNSPYNPFNSIKILMFEKWIKSCIKGDYLPPPMVDVDPSNRCNFKCGHCNAWDIIHQKSNDPPTEHLLALSDFFKEWGVKSVCVSGGGEPMMNKGFNDFLISLNKNGIEIGPISNGSLMTEENMNVIASTCRWMGFSIDAATTETFNKIKGISSDKIFKDVLNRIEKLCKIVYESKSKCDVAFKFLLTPDNAHEILDAVKLAKEIGIKDFHLRPACWDNITMSENKKSFEGVINIVNEQVEEAMKLGSENFRVYGVRHKFNSDFTRKVNFKKCWLIPMLPTFGADGNVHTCFDMRGKKDLILCKHFPNSKEILSIWNTDKHRDIVNNIDPNKCPRCTFGSYNETVEKVFIEDSMCRNFL